MLKHFTQEFKVTDEQVNLRLDQVLAKACPEYSRVQLQTWLKAGYIKLDGRGARASEKVHLEQSICIDAPLTVATLDKPEAIQLNIVFEDEYFIIVNKPPGLVVHPGAGNASGTLVNALLSHLPHLNELPRAGLVHRLDKDTSGLMVIAKTEEVLKLLIDALQARLVSRQYQALVSGMFITGGTIDKPIGRHGRDRTKMAVTERGKTAITHFKVLKKFKAHCLLDITLETGRTHQIRVHFANLGNPILGDKTYGSRPKPPKQMTELELATLNQFPRQALHAYRLGFQHPILGNELFWEVPLPADMAALVDILQKNSER